MHACVHRYPAHEHCMHASSIFGMKSGMGNRKCGHSWFDVLFGHVDDGKWTSDEKAAYGVVGASVRYKVSLSFPCWQERRGYLNLAHHPEHLLQQQVADLQEQLDGLLQENHQQLQQLQQKKLQREFTPAAGHRPIESIQSGPKATAGAVQREGGPRKFTPAADSPPKQHTRGQCWRRWPKRGAKKLQTFWIAAQQAPGGDSAKQQQGSKLDRGYEQDLFKTGCSACTIADHERTALRPII